MSKNDISYESFDLKKHNIYDVKKIVEPELSEPYSIFTYKFFYYIKSELSFVALNKDGEIIGTITGYTETKKDKVIGYIAMLVVNKEYRGLKIGVQLVKLLINKFKDINCDQVTLDVDYTNKPAISLYDSNITRLRIHKNEEILQLLSIRK